VDESEVSGLQAQLQRLQRRLRREVPSIAGLSRSAVRALGVIARSPGGAQPGEIGDELHMATSNVAAALRELETAGFVERRRDTHDRRRAFATLTPSGADAVAEHRSLRAGWLHAAITAELDAEEQEVLRAAAGLLGRLADHRTGP
jgi:DNA-binding MarR family transcriptional regulator